MFKSILFSTALLLMLSACCNHTPEKEAEQQTPPKCCEEKADTNKYLIQAEMVVNTYSVHFAHDKEKHSGSEYKNKIMIYGSRTAKSTHPFSYAELWFEGKKDSIKFDSTNACLLVYYPKSEFAQLGTQFIPGVKLRISYSLAENGGEHILVSTIWK